MTSPDALGALFELMPSPLAVVSPGGEVALANGPARALLLGDPAGAVPFELAATELGRHICAAGMTAARESGTWTGSVPGPSGEEGSPDLHATLFRMGPGEDDAFGLLLSPVSEAVAAEDRARLLAAVIEQSTELVAYHGPIGVEARINPAGAALVGGGLQADRPLPVRIRELFTEESQEVIRDVGVPAMEGTGSWRARTQLRNRDTGEVRDLDWSMFIVRAPDGRVLGTAGMGRDVTDQVRAMRELERAHAELAELYERTRELEALKTQFFTKVSHELRTPLTLILAPVEQLLASLDPGDPRHRELVVVKRNAEVLLTQVNNLLDAARLEAGAMGLQYSELDLAQEVTDAAAFFESAAVDAAITLTVRVPPPVPAQADRDHVHRILGNLLSNAFKATPRGGAVRCELRVEAADGRAVLEVADSGPGVAADDRTAVFERFQQLRPTGRIAGGTGLGLTIVSELAQLHGGSITVSEAPEGGALFAVRLPLRAPAGAAIGRASKAAPQPTRFRTAPESEGIEPDAPAGAAGTVTSGEDERPLVVVVEDNPDLNRMICTALGSKYRIVPAFDGEEGLQAVLDRHPDLVVTDVMMPRRDGTGLLRAVREHPDVATTPVLVLSARAEAGSRLELLKAGANDYLAKPFTLQELRVRTDNLIRAAEAENRRRRAQVGRDRDRIAEGLHERVLAELFAVSLRLGGVRGEATGRVGQRIDEAVQGMDDVIRHIREAVFDPSERPAPPPRVGYEEFGE